MHVVMEHVVVEFSCFCLQVPGFRFLFKYDHVDYTTLAG